MSGQNYCLVTSKVLPLSVKLAAAACCSIMFNTSDPRHTNCEEIKDFTLHDAELFWSAGYQNSSTYIGFLVEIQGSQNVIKITLMYIHVQSINLQKNSHVQFYTYCLLHFYQF